MKVDKVGVNPVEPLKSREVVDRESLEAAIKREGVKVVLGDDVKIELEPVPSDKVEAIKKSIKDGSYEVSPEKISEAIIRDLLGL